MGLFGGESHIKSSKELHRALKKERYLTLKERKVVEDKARGLIRQPSGLSKKEWREKVALPFEKGRKDIIDIGEARRLKKLGR